MILYCDSMQNSWSSFAQQHTLRVKAILRRERVYEEGLEKRIFHYLLEISNPLISNMLF